MKEPDYHGGGNETISAKNGYVNMTGIVDIVPWKERNGVGSHPQI